MRRAENAYAWSRVITPYRTTMLIICIVQRRHIPHRLSRNVQSQRDSNFKRFAV